jgi:hypothetical protein
MAVEIFIDISNAWSFTDCFSFVVMRGLRLREALSKDRHFRSAGSTPLLARPRIQNDGAQRMYPPTGRTALPAKTAAAAAGSIQVDRPGPTR